MSKYLKIIFIICLLIFGLKYCTKQFRNTGTILGRISTQINRDNSIFVTSNGLVGEEIVIKWVPDFLATKIVYSSNSERSKIGNEYGMNKFEVSYRGNVLKDFAYFKTNNWHCHEYMFDISMEDKIIYLKFEANGPNKLIVNDSVSLINKLLIIN